MSKDRFAQGDQYDESYSTAINTNFGKNILPILNEFEGKQGQMIAIDKLYPAPKAWDRLEPVSDEETAEYVDSILQYGLQEAVTLWKIPKNKLNEYYTDEELERPDYGLNGKEYMVVSGHNRANCYRILYQKTNQDKYMNIPSFVYKDLAPTPENINRIRNIIIDTNARQRTLTPAVKAELVAKKHELYSEAGGDESNETIAEQIARDMGLGLKTVYTYRNIRMLYPPLRALVVSNKKLNIEIAGKHLLKFSDEMQKWLYDNYKDVLTTAMVLRFKPDWSESQIEECISAIQAKETERKAAKKRDTDLVELKINVPKILKQEIEQLVKDFIRDNNINS